MVLQEWPRGRIDFIAIPFTLRSEHVQPWDGSAIPILHIFVGMIGVLHPSLLCRIALINIQVIVVKTAAEFVYSHGYQ